MQLVTAGSSDEQKTDGCCMASLNKIGAFTLTDPDHSLELTQHPSWPRPALVSYASLVATT
ncbi:MAG: hypothetical protein M3460_30715 [Actinomycetota bacterium]|nr:hypothetical protein [Actinomycetota bacterium]